MAEHKVPQDVEADDKLLGPFSFRQFIYLMIAFGSAALAYFLGTKVAMPLAILPLPIFAVFGTLSIPRKGQPMEIYVGAMLHFYLQPTRRIWDSDGQEFLVEITNPPIDAPQTKSLTGAEASRRLSFLADLEDTQGWSTRGNVNLNDDFALAANTAIDVFEDASLNEIFDSKLIQSEQHARDQVIAHMNTAAAPAATPVAASQPIVTPPPVLATDDEAALSAMLKQSAANNSMVAFQQTVIQPPGASPVLDNPTLSTTAMPAEHPSKPIPEPTPEPAPAPVPPPPEPKPEPAPEPEPIPLPPPRSESTPESIPAPEPRPDPVLPDHEPELESEPEPQEDESETDAESDIIEEENDAVIPSVDREINLRDAGADDSNQDGEISLH